MALALTSFWRAWLADLSNCERGTAVSSEGGDEARGRDRERTRLVEGHEGELRVDVPAVDKLIECLDQRRPEAASARTRRGERGEGASDERRPGAAGRCETHAERR